MAWYRVGTIALTSGSDLVTGTGTAWVQNAVPGGILFTNNGLALEVKKAISDTSLQLAEPYTGPNVAGLAYGIAPTQSYVPELTAKLQDFLDELGPLRQEWLEGNLQGQGLALKGALDDVSELPATGNTSGDGYMVGPDLYIWTGTEWSNRGKMVTTEELENLRGDTIAARNIAIQAKEDSVGTRLFFEDRNYPGVYASLPTTKPHSGLASEDGDTCVALVGDTPHMFRRLGGVWVIPEVDGSLLATPSGLPAWGFSASEMQETLDNAHPQQSYAALRAYTGRAKTVNITSRGVAGTFRVRAGDSTSPDNGGTCIVDASGRRWWRDYFGPVAAGWFEALGNPVDESVQVQRAIDYVRSVGGGSVHFDPALIYRCNVVGKDGVVLRSGVLGGFGYLPSSPSATAATLMQAGPGYVVDTAGVRCFGVHGINFKGQGAAVAGGGVRLRGAGWSFVKSCSFDAFADEGLKTDSSCGACTFEDILTTNVVLNRNRTSRIGAVDIAGNDHFLSRIEAGISAQAEGNVQSPDLYCVGVYLRGFSCMLSKVLGEYSDAGVWVEGSYNRLGLCRGDKNYGPGWVIMGGSNTLSSCQGLNNSLAATNTYSNWVATSASAHNLLVGCNSLVNGSILPKFGFDDQVSSDTNKNFYVGCYSDPCGTAEFNNMAVAGSSMEVPRGMFRPLAVNSVTPSVSAYGSWRTANTTATTITNFLGGVAGQEIDIYCGDDNTTIAHNGSTITTSTDRPRKLVLGGVYRFKKHGNTWREVGREKQLRVQVDVNPPAISNLTQWTYGFDFAGVDVGDHIRASANTNLLGVVLTAYPDAANHAVAVFTNLTGAERDLPSLTIRAEATKW